jgi:hypothetical protein
MNFFIGPETSDFRHGVKMKKGARKGGGNSKDPRNHH